MSRAETHHEFESLARSYLVNHPEIPHAWESVADAFGGRTDLICWGGKENEVFASLCNYQIAIGGLAEEQDFEDFGRGLTATELATEAFGAFKSLLQRALQHRAER